mgnify:CR=1 FL=1
MNLKGDFFMARHRVEIVGVNTANINVLSNEEMLQLFNEFHNGDLQAKEQLIKGNLKLVLSVLKKYNNRTDNLDDLFQIGCIGLIKAIDNFDLEHDVKFSTYAVPMILGEIKRYLRDNNAIRVTRSLKDIAFRGLRVKEELTHKLNREPTNKEIADSLEIPELDVIQAFEAVKDTVSMSEPIYSDGGDTIYLSEQIADNNDKINWDTRLMLKEALNKLKDKEKFIIQKRYFEGITQIELSEEIGISQAQISRIEKNGLDNMKKMLK